MTDDIYMTAIAVLLPLTAGLLVVQTNPYHALVIRGILGALAALVYVLFGAADVALTEALVGTMLSITLYAIAVRSSMRMQLGILASDESAEFSPDPTLLTTLKEILNPYHLHLETVVYRSISDLQSALDTHAVHGILIPLGGGGDSIPNTPNYRLQIRVQRLVDIFKPELPSEIEAVGVLDGDATDTAQAVQLS